MRTPWNHAAIVDDIKGIMGKGPRDQRMPRDRLCECQALNGAVAQELDLPPADFPQLRDDLLEGILRQLVDSHPGEPALKAARILLGLTRLTESEITKILNEDKTHGLRAADVGAGYKSKAVRQYLAGKVLYPPLAARTVRLKERQLADSVAVALRHLLDKHPDKVRSIAVRLGILKEVPPEKTAAAPASELRNKGDLKLWAGVANVTRGDTTYAKEVTARSDDVVKIQMTYESTAPVKALRDFVPHFELPTERGREHRVVVSGTALGGHVAEASVVVTSTIRGTLIYVSGTAKWRHNTAVNGGKQMHENVQIGDSIIGPHPLPVDNVLPGPRHRSTIIILARVISDQVRIRLVGKSDLTKSWRQDIAVRPGGQVLLRFEICNLGNRPLRSMFVYCNIPEGAALVPGSVSLIRPDGEVHPLSDELVRAGDPTGRLRHAEAEDGLSVGTLPVGETVNVDCDIRIEKSVKMGSIVTVVGVVRPLGMNEFYNTVKIAVQR